MNDKFRRSLERVVFKNKKTLLKLGMEENVFNFEESIFRNL